MAKRRYMTDEITVESGVPIPRRLQGGWGSGIWVNAVRLLKVGDSIPVKRREFAGRLASAARRVGIGYVTRRCTDGRYRLWRTK